MIQDVSHLILYRLEAHDQMRVAVGTVEQQSHDYKITTPDVICYKDISESSVCFFLFWIFWTTNTDKGIVMFGYCQVSFKKWRGKSAV